MPYDEKTSKILSAACWWYNCQGTGEVRPLEELLEAIMEAFKTPPDRLCSICGRTDTQNEEDGYGSLVDITVIVAEGEEGYARIRQYLCWEHLESQADSLKALGFSDHQHGGADFLEDETCIGAAYDENYHLKPCPTPNDPYEEVFVVKPSKIEKTEENRVSQ